MLYTQNILSVYSDNVVLAMPRYDASTDRHQQDLKKKRKKKTGLITAQVRHRNPTRQVIITLYNKKRHEIVARTLGCFFLRLMQGLHRSAGWRIPGPPLQGGETKDEAPLVRSSSDAGFKNKRQDKTKRRRNVVPGRVGARVKTEEGGVTRKGDSDI